MQVTTPCPRRILSMLIDFPFLPFFNKTIRPPCRLYVRHGPAIDCVCFVSALNKNQQKIIGFSHKTNKTPYSRTTPGIVTQLLLHTHSEQTSSLTKPTELHQFATHTNGFTLKRSHCVLPHKQPLGVVSQIQKLMCANTPPQKTFRVSFPSTKPGAQLLSRKNTHTHAHADLTTMLWHRAQPISPLPRWNSSIHPSTHKVHISRTHSCVNLAALLRAEGAVALVGSFAIE